MQNEIEAKKSAEREDQMKSLPAPVQEAIDAYGKYYAKHHKLGMSVRDDMTYIAQMAMRWIKPTDATEIEAAADELRWYSKHLGDFNGKPNKPWAEHFNDDINALRDMALMEKARADWLAADGVVVPRETLKIYKNAPNYMEYIGARFKDRTSLSFEWNGRRYRYLHTDFDDAGDFDALLAAAKEPR